MVCEQIVATVDSLGQIGVTANDVLSSEGVVAVSQSAAAEVGRHVLASGGNAVDAAIAVQFALNVVEPSMSGIGGGTYVTYFDAATERTHTFDARETVSGSLDIDDYRAAISLSSFESSTHGHAVGVPGTVRLLNDLSRRFGSMSIGDLVEPSIRLCVTGVRVNRSSARYMRRGFDRIRKSGEAFAEFCPGGRLLSEGDVLVQQKLAKTLFALQNEGLDAFYEGHIAESVVDAVRERGGCLTLRDLASYTVKEREPLRCYAFGYELASMGPSSSGGITLFQILKMMERFDFDQSNPFSADYLHYLIEVMHLAYADRVTHIGDPDYCTVPVDGLLDPDYLDARLSLVQDNASAPTVDPGQPVGSVYNGVSGVKERLGVDDRREKNTETTHFSIADRWGNVIAFTTSIGRVFGSGVMAKNAGFLLNSTGGGLSTGEVGPNVVEPGKRPLSSIAPTFVLDQGKPVLALGTPGAITIIGSIAQVLLNTLGFGRGLQESILTPRIFSSSHPRVEWESGIPVTTRQQLVSYGHAVESDAVVNIGDVHAVARDWSRNVTYGASDDNRDGTVLSVDGKGRSIGRENRMASAVRAGVRLVWDGVPVPLTDDSVMQSERSVYFDAEFLEKMVSDIEDNQRLEEIYVGARRFVNLSSVCHEKGFDLTVDFGGGVLNVDTGKELPPKNAVQLKYANERMSITR